MLKTLRDLGMGMPKRPKRCDTGKREDPGDEVAANCFFFSKWRLRKDLQNCVWLQMVKKVSCYKTSVLACAQILPKRGNICHERILTG